MTLSRTISLENKTSEYNIRKGWITNETAFYIFQRTLFETNTSNINS